MRCNALIPDTELDATINGIYFYPVCQECKKLERDKEKKRRWAYGKHYTGKAKEGK